MQNLSISRGIQLPPDGIEFRRDDTRAGSNLNAAAEGDGGQQQQQQQRPRPSWSRVDEEIWQAGSDEPSSHVAGCNKQRTIATVYGDTETSYGDMLRIASFGAARVAGTEGSAVVAVCARPSDRLVHLLVAVLRGGSAHLPIDPGCPPSRLRHILAEARPKLLVVDDDGDDPTIGLLLDDVADLRPLPVVKTIAQVLAPPSDEMDDGDCVAQGRVKTDICVVMYTSGSSGTPKGVLLSHRAVLNRLRWQFRAFPYEQDETCCFKTALTFVDSVSELFGPLCRGKTLVVVPKATLTNPEALIAILERHRIRRLVLVPTLLRLILACAMESSIVGKEGSAAMLPELKTWICSGEALAPELVVQFFAVFPQGKILSNFYGSTEVMGDVLFHVMRSDKEASSQQFVGGKVPVGAPVANTIVYLLDEDMKPVTRGQTGQIWVAGKNLADGYVVGGLDRLADRFQPNLYETFNKDFSLLYATGDYARMTPEGSVVFEGRVDSQVKVRGHRVDLAEIEAAFDGCPGLRKAVVLCHRPSHPDQAIVAFCCTSSAASSVGTEAEITTRLTGFIRSKVPDYMQPTVVLLVDEDVPLLTNGKIDRQALLRLFRERRGIPQSSSLFSSSSSSSAGKRLSLTTPTEADCPITEGIDDIMARILAVIESILGPSMATRTIQPVDNFFSIGGNSLNAVAVCLALNDAGLPISITSFLEAPDLQSLGSTIRESLGQTTACRERRMAAADTNGGLSSSDDGPTCFTNRPVEGGSDRFIKAPLEHDDWSEVSRLLAESFCSRSEIERCIEDLTVDDFLDFLGPLWDEIVRQGVSFSVKTKDDNGRILGATLNFDLDEEPRLIDPPSSLRPILDMLEAVEEPQRKRHFEPRSLRVIHNFMMGVDLHRVGGTEAVTIMHLMEREIVRLARELAYDAVFTTNTSPITRQLGEAMGYEVLDDFQVNSFVAEDGSAPFASATDDVRAVCSVKYLTGSEDR